MTAKTNQQRVGDQANWEAMPFGYFNLCSPTFRDRHGDWLRWEAVAEDDGFYHLYLVDGFDHERVTDRAHRVTTSFDLLVSDAAKWAGEMAEEVA